MEEFFFSTIYLGDWYSKETRSKTLSLLNILVSANGHLIKPDMWGLSSVLHQCTWTRLPRHSRRWKLYGWAVSDTCSHAEENRSEMRYHSNQEKQTNLRLNIPSLERNPTFLAVTFNWNQTGSYIGFCCRSLLLQQRKRIWEVILIACNYGPEDLRHHLPFTLALTFIPFNCIWCGCSNLTHSERYTQQLRTGNWTVRWLQELYLTWCAIQWDFLFPPWSWPTISAKKTSGCSLVVQ